MSKTLRSTIIELDQAVPRYTSYPAAPHFQDLQNNNICTDWLKTLDPRTKLSLYLHVPFCHELCWYCGCHTKITKRYPPIKQYIALLLQEIDILACTLPKEMEIGHIHFGGGSPGIVSAKDFQTIMTRLRYYFSISDQAEIAIELDPRGVDEKRIEAYASCGVNRVSLGAQDFNEKVLKSVNRPQPYELSQKTVELLQKNGIKDVNLDLIYGLPYQTTENMTRTIDQALELNPSRIALFGYAHVPWMKKHMRLIDESALPDQALRFDLFETGANHLENAGYIPIGIDHFAQENDEMAAALKEKRLRRNFQGYTSDNCDALIGLGASSIGKLPQGYIQNTPDMHGYNHAISNNSLPIKKYCAIKPEDQIYARVIEQIMCYLYVDLKKICTEFDLPASYFDSALEQLSLYTNKNVLNITNNSKIQINPKARTMARLAASAFDQHTSNNPKILRHAKSI